MPASRPFSLWSERTLASKISILMSLLVMLTILGLTYLSSQRERANFQQDLEAQATFLLETTTLTLRDPLYQQELDELREVAQVVGKDPNILFFTVYDQNGKRLVDSREQTFAYTQTPDALGITLLTQAGEQVFLQWMPDHLLAGKRVSLGNQVIGAVAAGLSTQTLDAKIRQITWQSTLTALLALVIGGTLTWLFARQITTPLRQLTEAVVKISDGDFSLRVQPYAGDEIGRLSVVFNQMAEGLQEREWLHDMFGRFVSREVAEAIRSGQVQLEGENRVVSVLFCDIRGFTEFSERHSPQEVVAMLNNYLPLVVQSAQKHGGMVNKFGGDSTLIIYGAPREMEDSAYRAVLTAIEIRQYLMEFNKTMRRRGDEPIRVGVGINTGVALAGAVGPTERQEYTVIGNTVNLAARIDGLNKQYPEHEILISGWTYEALGAHRAEFDLLPLGAVAIRGKNQPIEIWAVQGRRSRRF